MKNYEIFNMGVVHVDSKATVRDMVIAAYERYHRKNNMDFNNITIYDEKGYKIVLDNSIRCSRAKLGDRLCIAYYIPKKFYYVEGGWGCHMIDMNAKKHIPHPITFDLKVTGVNFVGWPVVNGNIRINEWIDFLASIKLIQFPISRFKVYPNYLNDKSTYSEYDIAVCGNKKIKSIKELESQWCTVIIGES